MAERLWRRKRFYVHPIQRKYFLLSLIPLILCSFLILFFLFLPLDLLVLSEASPAERAALIGQLRVLGVRIWPAIFLSMLISAILSLFVTHKFAGPLYRFEETARRMAAGDFSFRVKLRGGDDLRELETLLNQVLSNFSSSIVAIREKEVEAREKLEALVAKLKDEGERGELLADLEELLTRHQEIQEALDQFQSHRTGEA